uniref:2-phosphoxylose phosphatase 1 n=1 Tax=Plectus sambesii TaxID=2011161 RepID=A0A914V1Q9_9BILA
MIFLSRLRPMWCYLAIGSLLCLSANYYIWPKYFAVQEATKIPPLFREFCQFLEDPLQGGEGEVPADDFKLRAIFVTVRHGERSPLHPESTIEDNVNPRMECAPRRMVDKQAFDVYRKFVESGYFGEFLQIDHTFDRYAKLPARKKCRNGHLTAEGALQHVRLGKFLRERYRKWKTFDTGSKVNISLSATSFPRTFQSAIAFSYGFFYPGSSSLSLRASRTTHFCMSDNCSCPVISTWHSDFELERAQFYERDVPEREHVDRLAIEASDILRIGEAKDPLAFLDVLLGRFVCRRFPLPCDKRSGKCVTWQSLTQAADLASSRAEAMFGAKAPNSNVMRRLSIGEAAAILRTLTATIRKLRKDDELTAFKLFSGHDVTLRPLLFALGLTHREPAHYASRL